MDNIYEVKEQAKKFNKRLTAISLAVFIPVSTALIFVTCKYDFWWTNVLFVVFLILALSALVLYIGRNQRAVLLNDMNPQLYYAIVHAGDINKIGTDADIEIFYFAGDYQKVINYANAQIEAFNAKGKKYANLNTLDILAFAYFEIGDYENAAKTIEYIKALADEMKLTNKKGYTQIILPQLEYIESFVKCDFNKCLELENGMLAAKFKKSNTFIARNKYYTALANYYLGDMSGAKQSFEEVLSFCPKLNYANLAKQYLDAMQSNEIMTLNKLDTAFKYDGSIIQPNPQQVKKAKRTRIITLVIALFTFLMLIVQSIVFSNDDRNMNDYDSESISIVLNIQQE